MPDEVCITAEGGSVKATIGGERVSGLSINMRRLQVAQGALVECGGIGGVGTAPAHRGRGLSTRVMAEAMAHHGRLGKPISALYTGARIVAHRLYRKFGFADVFTVRERVKYLDFAGFVKALARRSLAHALSAGGSLSGRAKRLRADLALTVIGEGEATVSWRGGKVKVSAGASGRAGAAVEMSACAFNSLAGRGTRMKEAVALGHARILRGDDRGTEELLEILFGEWESPLEGR